MSKYLSEKYSSLEAYTPGEQPKNMEYVKLNTNESPYPPSKGVTEAVFEESKKLMLYSDPESLYLRQAIASLYGLKPENILPTNGSDEIINFAFMAFCDKDHPIVFPNITYGFYTVFGDINMVPYEEIPLNDDFTINYKDYLNTEKNIIIANPNAPTGIALGLDKIEEIVKSNPDNVVIIDEAYVDFGGESAIPLTKKYDNLLVTQTFSKSRSMAGARLGFGVGNKDLIADLDKIKYSTNPYNVNRMTSAAGIAAIAENEYYMDNARKIISTREYTVSELKKRGFTVLDSSANFIFAKSDRIGGEELYLKLKENGVLIRHFTNPLIADYNRITIGTKEQMDVFLEQTDRILKQVIK